MTWDWRTESWLEDARKIPDKVMSYIRKLAVYAIEEKRVSPEIVSEVMNIDRTCIYEWIKKYDRGGITELETQVAPGAEVKITEEMDKRLREMVLEKSPLDYGYDTVLWTRGIVAELLRKRFRIEAADSTVGLHLRKIGLSYQKPAYRAREQDREKVRYFLEVKFPKIQRVAKKRGAEVLFEDESGIRIMTRYGYTWGERGKTPKIQATDKRGGYNALSMVSAKGKMRYSIKDKNINSKRYVEFLKQILRESNCPIFLITDNAKIHTSKYVINYVRSNRKKIRVFFLPKHSPELNPSEQVWREIKCNRLGKQPIKNKNDLKKKLFSALSSLQKNIEKIKSFFRLPDTLYASLMEDNEINEIN